MTQQGTHHEQPSVRIIIADDHVVLRQGLRTLLQNISGLSVVGEASDGFEVLPLVDQLTPDLLIIDLSMPNLGGIETIARLKNHPNKPGVLVLSALDDEASVGDAMEAGASAFLPKSAALEELRFAIQAVIKGQTYLSPGVCEKALRGKEGSGERRSILSTLSSREREVMKLLAEGQPNREVAKRLHISPRTIDSHRANIMKKLGITSNAELVNLAIKGKLIE